MVIAEVCGWLGAILVLFSYFLVSFGKVNGDSLKFQIGNIAGAAFLIYYTYSCHAYASAMVNTIWVIIGLKSLLNMRKRQKLLAAITEAV